MNFTLKPELQKFLAADKHPFDALMALRGKIYRELEGRRTQRIELGEQAYFLKQHFGIGWKEIFKNLFQGRLPVMSAKNEWLAIQQLQKLGIATLHVAGFGSRGFNPAAKKSFLLTTELTHVISLEDLSRDWKNKPPAPAFKRRLISEVARIARTIHQHGINHRDFYICHFLLDTQTEKNAPTLYLIDLHRAQIRSKTPLRWLIKDLAGLYFSSKDIGLTSRDVLRFIREYRQQSLRPILNKERNFWQKVKQRGDKTYREHGN